MKDRSNVGSPFKKSSASEPINLPSHLYDIQSQNAESSCDVSATNADEASQKKKRRLQSKSLDDIIISPPMTFKASNALTLTLSKDSTPTGFKTPRHLKSPSTPLSPLVVPSFWTTVPVNLSPAGTPQKVMPPPPLPPLRQTCHHSSYLSCPVDSDSPKRPSNNASNFSFDSG